VNSVLEIKQAIRQLPPREQLEIARLMDNLRKEIRELQLRSAVLQAELERHAAIVSEDGGDKCAPLPDYSARRRQIFGSKVVPNMVLEARAEEPW
jgi:hypothetical protein